MAKDKGESQRTSAGTGINEGDSEITGYARIHATLNVVCQRVRVGGGGGGQARVCDWVGG